MMKRLLAALILAAAATPTHATTLAGILSRDQIIIGADSGVSLMSGKMASNDAYKIFAVGPSVCATGGLYRTTSGFDIERLVTEAGSTAQGLKEQAEAISARLRPALTEALVELKASDPAAFQRWVAERQISSVWIAGKEDGQLAIYDVSATVTPRVDVTIELTTTRVALEKNQAAVAMMRGPHSISQAMLDLNPKKATETNYLVSRAMAIVQAGINDPDGLSYGPIDIVQVRKDGTHQWLQRK